MSRMEPVNSRRRPSRWGWLVAVSGGVLLLAALVLGVWWLASGERRITTYSVSGALNGVRLDLAGASAVVVGSPDGRAIAVRRTDRYTFGHSADARRDVTAGILRLRSRCPATVLASCSASYRVTVPDNLPVTVRTSSGDVRLSDFRGSARIATGAGSIVVGGYCGFLLQARAQSGDVQASAACAPERVDLRSGSGDVRVAVPRGRYRVDADSGSGTSRIAGLTQTDDAPFQIQAISSLGDVEVASRP